MSGSDGASKLGDRISRPYVMLTKDSKPICRTECLNPPSFLPSPWDLRDIVSQSHVPPLVGLPCCQLRPAAESSRDQTEWVKFIRFLRDRSKVAIAKFDSGKFYILPPGGDDLSQVRVAYQIESETSSCTGSQVTKLDRPSERNYIRADPSYLQTLGQAHSGWVFGAIAELVDNSRDAKARRLDIKIEMVYSRIAGKNIPMLAIIDDGHGMTHQDVLRMTYFGHKRPHSDDVDRIGRFGIGFKTGAMRLGRNALVLTQTANSRSIAFLSQTLNEGKDNLEIPVVSYRRKGQFMEIDTSIQSEALAKHNLKAIKEVSPFDKYLIGEKAGLFREKDTGTQIYVWNLDEWGSNYCLDWQTGLSGGSSFHQGDILIRSRRIRSRPGQISQEVPLDYSLRAYLEVMFLVPRMQVYVQGSQVKSRPLEKTLSRTCVETGTIMGKPVQLTLGHCQIEWERANCGIFLYWHGRLIEAYKRVGGMVHNGDTGRGVIGVVDVTSLMDGRNGRVWVHNNKQGFQDCEEYAQLEIWLGKIVDRYWDKNYDELRLKKGNSLYKPDHEWVQCDRCRKWRKLNAEFETANLAIKWFCYMKPFEGSCEIPEENVEAGVITIGEKRTGYEREETGELKGQNGKEERHEEMEEGKPQDLAKKRRRMSLPRHCKKG